MPGFSIGAIQSLRVLIDPNQLLIDNLDNHFEIVQGFIKMMDQVLMRFSTKTGNRAQLRMFFNPVDHMLNTTIMRKLRITRAERRYS